MAESYPLKPSSGLARELNKVEEAASALDAIMCVQNYLPPEFPENALNAMLAGLVGISDVSVDGADDILRAAMRRLPSYTTDYLQDLDDVDDDEEHGAWVRDGEIEHKFDKLIGAATKALHEVNKQKQQLGAEEPLPDRAIDNDLDDVTTHEAINLSIEADDGLKELHKAAKETLPDTEINENFERRVWDAKSVNNMSLAELRHPRFVKGWPEKLRIASIKASKKAEVALEKLYNGPAKHFDKFRERVKKAPAKTVIETAQHANRAFGNWLEQLNRRVVVFKQEQIPYVDPNVQKAAELAAVELLVRNQFVPDELALRVRQLELTGSDFNVPELLYNFLWLQSLDIEATKVRDLNPVCELKFLEALFVSHTKISDISCLKSLTRLRELWISDTKVKNLAALRKLKKLESLFFSTTKIENIDVLSNLSSLKEIDFSDTKVIDISSLKSLTSIEEVGFSFTEVYDFSPLESLINLKQLHMRETRIESLHFLKGLKNLEEVDLIDTQVTDWSPVAHVKTVHGRPENWNTND